MTSSLNVELVYIILKGITQFSYINKGEGSISDAKLMNIQLLNPKSEDATILLKKVKIKDVQNWNRTSSLDSTENPAVNRSDQSIGSF